VHRDPADFAVDNLALAGVKAGADVEPELVEGGSDRTGTADSPRRPVERGEEAVAGGVELRAPEAGELSANSRVVALQELPPSRVSERDGLLCRTDDVGEQHGRLKPFKRLRNPAELDLPVDLISSTNEALSV
jgi:hypothetical protein